MVPGPPLDADLAESIRRSLKAGTNPRRGHGTDDCHRTFEALTAKGVEFVQEPSDRPYGTEAILRDSSGNWVVLVETSYTGHEFPN